MHKIVDRWGDRDRALDEDASHIFGLVQAVPAESIAQRLETLLHDDIAGAVTAEALERIPDLSGVVNADGVGMAVRAAAIGEDPRDCRQRAGRTIR